MAIKLYFVSGISAIDTPRFNSRLDQQSYFANRLVREIDDDSFYPPYYDNRIRVQDTDCTVVTQVNYVSIEYQEKEFYYFINRVEYGTDGLLYLVVTMDTIQTFMFNMLWHNAHRTRKIIKRWNNDNSINRNYIRENFSSGLFKNVEYHDYTKENLNTDKGIIIAKTRSEEDSFLPQPSKHIATRVYTKYTPGVSLEDGKNYNLTIDGSTLWVLPPFIRDIHSIYDDYKTKYEYYLDGTRVYSATITYKELIDAYTYIQEMTEIVDMYYIPFNCTDIGISYNAETKTVSWNLYSEDNITDGGGVSIKNGYDVHPLETSTFRNVRVLAYSIEQLSYTKTYSFEFSHKNNNLTTPFNKNQIPQLIDENYIELQYGERIAFASFPLEKSNLTLTLHKSADVLTGYRNYWITNENDLLDKYQTMVVANTKESVVMFNDAFKNYIASSYGSRIIGSAYNVGKNLFNMAFAMNRLENAPKTRVRKDYTAKAKRQYASDVQDISSDATEYAANMAIALSNARHMPDSEKQGNNFTNDVIAKSLNEVLIVNYCTNIDFVATIYESIGWRVDEWVNGDPFENNRQMYNYIECDSVDFDLNVLHSEEIINDIANRYAQGIRFYTYSTTYLTTILPLGDICKYDNIETTS